MENKKQQPPLKDLRLTASSYTALAAPLSLRRLLLRQLAALRGLALCESGNGSHLGRKPGRLKEGDKKRVNARHAANGNPSPKERLE